MTTTPIHRMHIEAETETCTCAKLRCGGIAVLKVNCPEHFGPDLPTMTPFHTHAMMVDQINRGRHIA